jgi:hypothetical protein
LFLGSLFRFLFQKKCPIVAILPSRPIRTKKSF